MKKWMTIGCLAIIVVLGGCYYWRMQRNTAAAAAGPQYARAAAEYRPLRQEVSCSGSVVSNLDVEIKCKASGQIVEVPYDISDAVNKGDLLLKLDPVDEDRNVRKAEVQLASAEARLAQAKQNLVIAETELGNSRDEAHATLAAAEAQGVEMRKKAQRTAELQKREYASPEEVESAEASAVQAESSAKKAHVGVKAIEVKEQQLELLRQDIKLAEADVESSKISLDDARQRLTETQVFAPIAGIISDRLVQIGQIIASPTMNVSGGTSLLVLSDMSQVFVLASVDESDIGQVRVGQPATITVDAFPDERFKGEVKRVAAKGDKVSNVVTFEVKIEVLDEAKNKLLPEMTADVEILTAAKERALAVPAEAVIRRGPVKGVLTPGGNGPEPVFTPVTTGIDDGEFTEVLTGLQDGAAILIASEEGSSKEEKRSGFMPPPPGGGGPPPM